MKYNKDQPIDDDCDATNSENEVKEKDKRWLRVSLIKDIHQLARSDVKTDAKELQMCEDKFNQEILKIPGDT